MSVYYTDLIKWTSITRTENGGETGVSVELPARIEDTNKVIAGDNGSNIVARSLIFTSSKNIIQRGDEIQILKIRGIVPPDTDRVFQVREIMNNEGFGIGEWEIYI